MRDYYPEVSSVGSVSSLTYEATDKPRHPIGFAPNLESDATRRGTKSPQGGRGDSGQHASAGVENGNLGPAPRSEVGECLRKCGRYA